MSDRGSGLEFVIENLHYNGVLSAVERRVLLSFAREERREAAADAWDDGWHEHYLEEEDQPDAPDHKDQPTPRRRRAVTAVGARTAPQPGGAPMTANRWALLALAGCVAVSAAGVRVPRPRHLGRGRGQKNGRGEVGLMGATPDDRPALTPHPWPDMVEPTTDEFLPWFLNQTTEAQTWLLQRLREDSSRGRDCWLMNHAALIERLSRRAAETPEEEKMPRFRKRPVVIEARRFADNDSATDIFKWGGSPPFRLEIEPGTGDCNSIAIDTLEGTMWADRGDWIIRGVKGEFYPCKPDVFEATYEPADGPRS